eukprot:314756-Chlamydomonas_euryale.AAC.1
MKAPDTPLPECRLSSKLSDFPCQSAAPHQSSRCSPTRLPHLIRAPDSPSGLPRLMKAPNAPLPDLIWRARQR